MGDKVVGVGVLGCELGVLLYCWILVCEGNFLELLYVVVLFGGGVDFDDGLAEGVSDGIVRVGGDVHAVGEVLEIVVLEDSEGDKIVGPFV